MSVTVTLSRAAALDIVGMLKNLAHMLNISPPMSYKVADHTPISTDMKYETEEESTY